jgi:hypothetical protein
MTGEIELQIIGAVERVEHGHQPLDLRRDQMLRDEDGSECGDLVGREGRLDERVHDPAARIQSGVDNAFGRGRFGRGCAIGWDSHDLISVVDRG